MTNPASSGGAGTVFEAKVGASYLLSMLLEVEARGLPGCRIESVRLQRAEEGFPLDDIVVHGVSREGVTASIEIQVKRTLTFTASANEFKNVVRQIGAAFSRENLGLSQHGFGIAIGRTRQSKEPFYQDVLKWARNLEDAVAFRSRVERPGAANDAMRNFVAVFSANLLEAGFASDDDTVWRILRRTQILQFDFDSEASATNESMRDRSLRALNGSDAGDALNLWSRLTTLALDMASVGGSRTRAELVEELQTSFRLAGSRSNAHAMEVLFEESERAIAGFDNTVGGITLERESRMDTIREALEQSRYIEIRGDSGVGKSGLLHGLAASLQSEARFLVFTPNRVIERGWLSLKTTIAYDGDGRDLMNELSLSGAGILFVDNLDFYSPTEQETIKDLLIFAARHPTMRVVATARTDFGQVEPTWIPREALTRFGPAVTLQLSELDESELDELRLAAPTLRSLLSDSHPAKKIVRNLFRLSRLSARRVDDPWPATETQMARQWWETADGHVDSELRERARVLGKLARHFLFSSEPFDSSTETSGIIDALLRSGSLREFGRDRITFRHDVLREWAIANLLYEERGFESVPDLSVRTNPDQARGAELAARMALEDTEGISRWKDLIGSLATSHETWRRAVILAAVRSEDSVRAMITASLALLENDGALLRELIRYVLAVEFESGSQRLRDAGITLGKIPDGWKVPRGRSAGSLIVWLTNVVSYLPVPAIPEVVKLFSAYIMGVVGSDWLTARLLPLLLDWLLLIEGEHDADPYGFRNQIFGGKLSQAEIKIIEDECRTTFLFFCKRTPDLAVRYLLSFAGREHRDEIRIDVLKTKGSLPQAAPKEFADFALETLIPEKEPRRRRNHDYLPDRPFEFIDIKFTPSSPSQGPFLDLLIHAPSEGLRLVRGILLHAISFDRGDNEDTNAIVVYRGGDSEAYKWAEFYTWSRDYGSSSGLVVSALMALEAWGHRRIEEGEDIETVITDVSGSLQNCERSSAQLLVVTDILVSHWPASASAAIPFVGCPQLLCLDRTRPGSDNFEFPDLFGLKDIQTEPLGLVSTQDLKRRPSRRASLYDLLAPYTFHNEEYRPKLVNTLTLASERLGLPEKDSDLGDPRMMAIHALNVLNRTNWSELKDENGSPTGKFEYRAPQAERQQMEPIQKEAAPRLEEHSLRTAILNELYVTPETTEEFLTVSLDWAKKHESVLDSKPDFDWDGNYSTMLEAVVTVATLMARSGSAELLEKEGAWIRSIFDKAYGGRIDPVFSQREGLKFNPQAIAFVGQSFLLERSRQQDDDARLLRFVASASYAPAHGYRAILALLFRLNVRWLPSIMRCAFEASVLVVESWNDSEEEKLAHRVAFDARITARIDTELAWLRGQGSEPGWPKFPLKRATPRRRGIGRKPVEATAIANADEVQERVNYHLAALWLGQHQQFFRGVPVPSWMSDIATTYIEWTLLANGKGEDKTERFDRGPSEWNSVVWGLLPRCLGDREATALWEYLEVLFNDLPEEPLMSCLSTFIRSADVVHFDDHMLSVSQLLTIRTYALDRIKTTRLFSWNNDRDETSVTTDMTDILATFCFNTYNPFQPSKCYVPSGLVAGIDPFLPLLEKFIESWRSPFVTLMYLNLFEVAPRREQLWFVVGCTEKWLERFPQENRFWIEWNIGQRISLVLKKVFEDSPTAFAEETIRERIDSVISRLVGLGVPDAHELEQKLFRINS